MIAAHPGLVQEVDGRALGFGAGTDSREGLGLPGLDRFRVLLVGAPQRPLRGQAQGPQQSPDAHRRQGHSEFPADQLADQIPCP